MIGNNQQVPPPRIYCQRTERNERLVSLLSAVLLRRPQVWERQDDSIRGRFPSSIEAQQQQLVLQLAPGGGGGGVSETTLLVVVIQQPPAQQSGPFSELLVTSLQNLRSSTCSVLVFEIDHNDDDDDEYGVVFWGRILSHPVFAQTQVPRWVLCIYAPTTPAMVRCNGCQQTLWTRLHDHQHHHYHGKNHSWIKNLQGVIAFYYSSSSNNNNIVKSSTPSFRIEAEDRPSDLPDIPVMVVLLPSPTLERATTTTATNSHNNTTQQQWKRHQQWQQQQQELHGAAMLAFTQNNPILVIVHTEWSSDSHVVDEDQEPTKTVTAMTLWMARLVLKFVWSIHNVFSPLEASNKQVEDSHNRAMKMNAAVAPNNERSGGVTVVTTLSSSPPLLAVIKLQSKL